SALDETKSLADVLKDAGYQALIGGIVGGVYGAPASYSEARARLQEAKVNPNAAEIIARGIKAHSSDGSVTPESLAAAINSAPDADLQKASPRYRKLRELMSEAQAKQIMRDELV